jgi:hypothetical protein
MQEVIAKNPFYSVSQNDDVVYCEQCKSINSKAGGPQGSLYYFFKIAKHFPKTKITTLAYLHIKPPINLKIAPNIYTLFFVLSRLNRGKSIVNDNSSTSF